MSRNWFNYDSSINPEESKLASAFASDAVDKNSRINFGWSDERTRARQMVSLIESLISADILSRKRVASVTI